MKIIDYEILESTDKDVLAKQINAFLSQDYQLYGPLNVTCNTYDNSVVYNQAMVKYEEEKHISNVPKDDLYLFSRKYFQSFYYDCLVCNKETLTKFFFRKKECTQCGSNTARFEFKDNGNEL